MKNKTKKALCAASILGVVAISGIFAYLTDVDSKTNRFTLGDVDIELLEPSWDDATDTDDNGVPDFAENIVPGQVIEKDPKVANVGSNPAYVYLKVKVPKGECYVADDDGSAEYTETELFSYEINDDDWTLLASATDTSNEAYNEYVYYYNEALTNDTTDDANITTALFDEVELANFATRGYDAFDDELMNIAIEAHAIQSNNLPTGTTIADAYSLYTTQNSEASGK